MNIQIFGVKKCFDTKKAERYFKERNIKYQFIDLNEKAISKRELENIKSKISINDLININTKEYKTLNISDIRTTSVKEELLLKNPKLYKTPIVRNGKEATVGYTPDVWSKWE
ncbi:transcriptional regulator, Spx/MgsR family [Clostridium cavendishii DSM 21758]|uniref:Transcriptional regulator, Spx/MgsR family n=1 Tax=Clostridium cavendishii DSM 21758 TaxID=1121302 RepID=A0A1M6BCQ0_9CLOT|nr:arsenate reductase family protein [Clostridium cavendishii]SHI46524.1 transcriptional regulator, Spx/MgsR family [Clostridium cavendishii DSM 21758]